MRGDTRRHLAPAVLALLAIVAVVAPIVVALVVLGQDPLYPTGDMAQAELHVRGIWSNPPLVGAAGRIESNAGVQGSHPGPSLWFAMYPVYALLGSSAHALLAGAASVSLAAAGIAVWLAHRRGGWALALAMLALVALLVRASGPAVFTEPWNPWLAFVPFLAFVVTIWSVVAGDRRLWPLAVVLGSHCIQSHTGYIVVVLGLLGVAVLWPLARDRRDRLALRSDARWMGAAAGAGVVMWILPFIDQVTRDPGNAEILVQSFGSPDAPYLPRRVAVDAFLDQMSITGPWLTGPRLPEVSWPGTLAFIALWTAAVVIARRRHDVAALQAHGVLAATAALGALSISRIFGSYFEYTVRWMWIVAGSIVLASVVTLVRAGTPRVRRHVLTLTAVVTIIVGAVAIAQFADRAAVAGRGDGRLVGGLVDDVETALGDGAYLLRWWDPAGLGGPAFGLQLELERRGMVVGVDEQFSAAALPHRVLDEADSAGVLYLVVGAKADEVAATPGLERIASFDPRTADERVRSDALRLRIEAGLIEIGRAELVDAIDAQYGQARLVFADPPLPAPLATLIGEFVDLRMPGSVFVAPPGTPVPALGIG
jgi:hypothetical protein